MGRPPVLTKEQAELVLGVYGAALFGPQSVSMVAEGAGMCSANAPALGRAALLAGSLALHDPADTEPVFAPSGDVIDGIENAESISNASTLQSEAQKLNLTQILPSKGPWWRRWWW